MMNGTVINVSVGSVVCVGSVVLLVSRDYLCKCYERMILYPSSTLEGREIERDRFCETRMLLESCLD